LEFELEHFGHSKILSLFLETPTICLYYYPDLVPEGATRRRTIQDIRQRYDENLTSLYRYIKFVGMPVYKPEATRGVPMEDIYIPLSVTPDGSDPDELRILRINPFALLQPGLRSIILGDPGSGKSTLLRFLSLTGISEPLQNRYKALPDDRLPILVILRRYADELKSRKNLSLLDYIKEISRGDFNLSSADQSFFEYYLESGKAILLFDGLDELPSPNFKELVRDRIQSLTITYPGNTTIVTSRIVGYDHPFRFIEKDFNHYRVTRLDIEEIKQFVRDWYKVRIENEIEREANIKDLIRIIEDPGHIAIH
jgi:energy-coupling factor transporter ATP-binding protein EcfA2